MAKRLAAAVGKLSRTRPGETDRELLDRYTTAGDQEAFAALVGRHGKTVLAACRQVLADPADVDDAFQATFVVLLRKAKAVAWQASLGSWLYAVAHRVAVHARGRQARRATREAAAGRRRKTEAPPPDLSWADAVAVLHEELNGLPDRYRKVILLCYLDGQSRDEAAANLGVEPGAVKGCLERGRAMLAARLTRRGVTLSAGLLAVLAGNSRAAAGGPSAGLIDLTARACGGTPGPAVAALANGAFPMTITVKSVLLPVLLALGLVGLGAGDGLPRPAAKADDKPAVKADKKDAPAAKPAEGAKAVRGTVVGPDGKPVEGAVIATVKVPHDRPAAHELGRTDKDGRFAVTLDPLPAGAAELRPLVAAKPGFGPDWVQVGELTAEPVTLTLPADDVPVKGRVTDLEGKPVAKATVHVKTLAGRRGDLSRVWEEWPRDPYQALNLARPDLYPPWAAGLPEAVTADADGRFELRGAGRGRLLGLTFEAAGIETAACRVAVDPGFDPKPLLAKAANSKMPGPTRVAPDLYGPTFTHAAKPSQPVAGTVTDAKTGKPVPGAQVNGAVGGPHWWENHAMTRADANGRFRLTGIAKADAVSLSVFLGADAPYFPYSTTVSGKPGLTEIAADLKLTPGVVVTGRVTEKGTGRPVPGAAIHYTALADNKYYAERMAGKRGENGMAYTTDADGRFRLVVIPGAGILLAQGETRGARTAIPYTQVRVAKADLPRADLSNLDGLGEAFSAADGHIITLHSKSAYRIIEPTDADTAVDVGIEFDRGRTAAGTVVGPDGKPAAGVTAYKLAACYDHPQKLAGGAFTALGLDPDTPRTVLFVDEAKKLAASATLTGDEKDLTLKVQPWGKLAGRLVDAGGKPVAGATARVGLRHHIRHMAFAAVTRDVRATTAADGSFALEVPAGEVEYVVYFERAGNYLNTGDRRAQAGWVVKPGEATAVGEVTVKAE